MDIEPRSRLRDKADVETDAGTPWVRGIDEDPVRRIFSEIEALAATDWMDEAIGGTNRKEVT
jgi:hypothetical protein